MDTGSDKCRIVDIRKRLNAKHRLVQRVMKKKLESFGHIARMDNSREIKSVLM